MGSLDTRRTPGGGSAGGSQENAVAGVRTTDHSNPACGCRRSHRQGWETCPDAEGPPENPAAIPSASLSDKLVVRHHSKPLWPCAICGAPGFRNVYARGYCASHLADLYRSFSPDVWDLNGIGLPDGRRRPEYGPEAADLRCVACGATWVGPMFSPCTWCADARRRMAAWQARRVLTPPDVDPDDRLYDDRMRAWAERMARAVDAGIIARAQARAAWRRAVRREQAVAA